MSSNTNYMQIIIDWNDVGEKNLVISMTVLDENLVQLFPQLSGWEILEVKTLLSTAIVRIDNALKKIPE